MSTVDWSAIRADYEQGMSLRQLSTKYGISKSVIGERKFKEHWDRTDTRTVVSSLRVANPPTRDVNAVNRVALALKLRAQKLTYAEIAERAGYASASACRKAIQRELQRVVVENVEELRREEAQMYDIGHSECWLLFMDRTNTWRLTAWDRILATSIERRKLLGLDVRPDDVASGVTIIREYGVEVTKV